MTASIGAFSFLTMKGFQVSKLSMRPEILDRICVDGYGVRDQALKSEEGRVHTYEGVSSESSAQSAIDDYESLRGWLVTVIDDIGRTVDNVLVYHVVARAYKVGVSSPPGINWIIEADWTLLPTGT